MKQRETYDRVIDTVDEDRKTKKKADSVTKISQLGRKDKMTKRQQGGKQDEVQTACSDCFKIHQKPDPGLTWQASTPPTSFPAQNMEGLILPT